MRQLILLAGLLCPLLIPAQTPKKVTESRIDRVTVFLNGAQTQRSARVALTAGKQELVFSNISPQIDKQSIQVKAEGNVTVLSVIHQQNFLKEQQKQEEIRELETQRESLTDKIALQRNILNVYRQEETLLQKNQSIGGANSGLKIADLKEAADFQRARLTEVYQKLQETDKSIRKLETDLTKLNKQLSELNQKADISTSEIHVTVSVKENLTSNFTLTYLVKKAGWFATYDIRVKDISSPIELQYKANVFQQSGEDWKDVKLLLSSGNPDENGSKPLLNTWFLRYFYPNTGLQIRGVSSLAVNQPYVPGKISGKVTDNRGNPVAGASITIKGSVSGTTADANGLFSISTTQPNPVIQVSSVGYSTQEIQAGGGWVNINLAERENKLEEVVVVGYGTSGENFYSNDNLFSSVRRKKEQSAISTSTIYQPTTTVYEITDPYTILNDGKTYTVDIDGFEMKADYEYYAVPKLDANAYLTAKIADWQELNLLPGEANLFFEGTFLGKSMLDVTSAGDTLNLSLGKDKGVVIKRTLLKEFSSRKFMGSNKTDSRQYEILVRNNKQQPVSIVIADQFPVSTLKEIEVQDRKYDGAKLDDDTQELTWTIKLEARKETKLNFRYEVKYPKDKTLQLD